MSELHLKIHIRVALFVFLLPLALGKHEKYISEMFRFIMIKVPDVAC